jgi:hypothetical protein
MAEEFKIQTNLKLSNDAAVKLDLSSVLEGKTKAEIVEEALQLRAHLMGAEYEEALKSALAVRFEDRPERLFAAVENLRDEVAGATPGESVSVGAALARIRARKLRTA